MAHQQTSLLKKEEVAVETIAFTFTKPEGFTFEAGQSIDLYLTSLQNADAKGNMRAFSIASAPHEEHLMITTRIRESSFKQALKTVETGTAFELDGPFGSFTLHEKAERPAVILVGGIGITPFRSMIHDVVHRSLPHKLYLFYSNRRPEDAAFLDELIAFGEEKENITVVPTMTEMQSSIETWEGKTGYITKEMIEKLVPNESNPVYYMAGPQGMVKAMNEMLLGADVSKDDIRFEEFSGY